MSIKKNFHLDNVIKQDTQVYYYKTMENKVMIILKMNQFWRLLNLVLYDELNNNSEARNNVFISTIDGHKYGPQLHRT